jgi:osmotically-inducible protein OsmY
MSTPTPVSEAEGWALVRWYLCGCGGGPWRAGRPGWAGAATGVASQRGKGPATQRTDDQIKAVIEAVLTDDPWLDASGVQVSVQQGIVTLTGTVPSREAKRRAEALADRVGGVRDVRDVRNTLAIAAF